MNSNETDVLIYFGKTVCLNMTVIKESFFCLMLLVSAKADIQERTKELVKEWSPVAYLHSSEQFLPSNLDVYVAEMEVDKFTI